MALHDYAATFYGGYDHVALRTVRAFRMPWAILAVGVAAAVLVGLVAADAAVVVSGPSVVRVTVVSWYAEGYLLNTTAGFSVRTSAVVTFALTCDPARSFCFPFTGASVSAPFTVIAFSSVAHPIDYTNLTLRAPATRFDGPLTISLALP
ncbi:MAG TPA: hypothetical protein VML53_05015 [Thermoplasmata archaeon]|nr:hypothetical protein [Thermoplasmata archaeon]